MLVNEINSKKIQKSLFKRILVPFDDSDLATRAFWYAINMNFNNETEILLLSVIHSDLMSSSFLEFNTHQTVLEQNKLKKIKLKHMKLKKIASESQIPCKSILIASSLVTQSIISQIYASKSDLVIMGTRGNGNDRKLMLGSVSLEISQNSPVPVLLIK
ncbi:universal stress protein [Nitrosopumilus sp.]|uniref:universal stress protein n=1 Tax=Nitrosopumilus sp. TaxID=2024843 RepID=UPI0026366DC2|nr:universal stress protein [Nitrosopumilus sp.]